MGFNGHNPQFLSTMVNIKKWPYQWLLGHSQASLIPRLCGSHLAEGSFPEEGAASTQPAPGAGAWVPSRPSVRVIPVCPANMKANDHCSFLQRSCPFCDGTSHACSFSPFTP